MQREVVKGLQVKRERPTHVICSCGTTTARLVKGEARGSCDICGEFGYFARLNNCRFDTENIGHQEQSREYRRRRPGDIND